MTRAIVALSGGMDSTAALAVYAQHGSYDILAVSFDYGQRHSRELESARLVAEHLGVPHEVVDLRGHLSGSALLGDGDVPHGHYAADTMTQTVVNGRNLLFISHLVARTRPGDTVVAAVHAGDHFIYGDCRPAFIEPLRTAIAAAYEVSLHTPFLHATKADIARAGDLAHAPFALSWSCYEGGDIHCGRCGTCVERAEAFSLAGVPDPTEYADPEFWRTAQP
jgi:7-cyano-7-deazaguanine synthase